jgi:hypothetical protein
VATDVSKKIESKIEVFANGAIKGAGLYAGKQLAEFHLVTVDWQALYHSIQNLVAAVATWISALM